MLVAQQERYEVRGHIGRGTRGRVLRAVDSHNECQVAIKLLSPNIAPDPFLESMARAASISHPNVLRILEYGNMASGQPYCAMEVVDGPDFGTLGQALLFASLETWGVSMDGFGLADIMDLMIDVCDGVHAAHEAGVIHRDIKPQNILLERATYRAVLADWDLCCDASHPASSRTQGSASYLAPECFAEHPRYNALTDIYALGATLYTIIDGSPPYIRRNAPVDFPAFLTRLREESPGIPAERINKQAISWMIRRRPPTPLGPTARGARGFEGPRVPGPLVQVVERAMARKPSDRFQSAKALGQALAAALRDL